MSLANTNWEYERDLIRRLKTGDNAAWAEFTREYGAKLHNYLIPHLPDLESAEDLLSETFLASVKGIKRFPDHQSLTTWLYALAHRKVTEFWKKRNRSPKPEYEENSSTFENVEIERLEFLETLSALPSIEQNVLLLRYQIGLSTDEIATKIKRSPSTTTKLLTQARRHLREKLVDGEIEFIQDQPRYELLAGSILQNLYRQIKRCLSKGMVEEAEIFTRHAKLLAAMMTKQNVTAQKRRRNDRSDQQFLDSG